MWLPLRAMSQGNDIPQIQAIRELTLPAYETGQLANGMPVFALKGSSEPVMKMEIVFRAGGVFEKKMGVAECTAGLLSEGTKRLTSAQLAEEIESKGATLFTRGGVDTVRLRLLTLTKFFPALIDLFREVMTEPAFEPEELKVFTENKIERLKIELKKNEVLAYRHLTEVIFGLNHPYGKNITAEDYRAIDSNDLVQHHQQNILPERGFILLSGSYGDHELKLLEDSIGSWAPSHPNGKGIVPPQMDTPLTGFLEYDGPQTHQAAIRIGRKLFPQTHPDFNGLFVLNTILGGYFGSRLMTEIRENRGLTYGIYSSVDSFAVDGCFYISTETATDNTPAMIDAIRQEIKKLQQEPVLSSELDMARNYLMGHLMTQIDGPFNTMDFIKSLKIEQLDDSTFSRMVHTIQNITPRDLRELAERYLSLDEWVTIVVK